MDNQSTRKYDLAVIDPPYLYDNKQGNDPARGGISYNTMSLPELYTLPVSNIMKDNSLIVVWSTFPKICDTYEKEYSVMGMIRAWGFRPVTALFVWVKSNKSMILEYSDELEDMEGMYSGLGRYTNSNAEFAIVARRGKMLERKDKSVKQLIVAPIGKHSAKPQEQYKRLDRLFGTDIDRIELFARNDNLPPQGWDYTGLESTGEDIRSFR